MTKPDLNSIVSGKYTQNQGIIDLVLSVDFGGGNENIPFTYNPNDVSGLTPEVTAWLAAHPSFTPDAYVAPAITSAQVDAETQRRLLTGVTFSGHTYQFDDEGRQNITGAAAMAGFAIAGGAQVGDLRWADQNEDFKFIDMNNVKVSMDAQTMFALGQVAMKWKSDHVFAGRNLKDTDPTPTDYTDDKYWPG